MSRVASSVRITPAAGSRTSEERLFWEEVKHAFAQSEAAEMAIERELWDSTVNDGLAGERW